MREHRLGLALSGGGFRASLFHLGVLRRLAELGLLRRVTHISTVSGGSIVAALYYLHFKGAFEASGGELDNAAYVSIVGLVEKEFIAGVKRDLRNRLLVNPFAQLADLVAGNGFGQQMARLYTKFFYRSAIERVFWRTPEQVRKRYLSLGVPLHQLIVRLPGQPAERFINRSSGYPNTAEPEIQIVDFNDREDLANIPSLVINSTCLNTGGPFYFTFNEIGGPECGFVRTDEVFMLLQYKLLLESLGDEPVEKSFLHQAFNVALQWGKVMSDSQPELPQTAFQRTTQDQPAEECFPPRTFEHLCFYQAARARMALGEDFTGDSWVPPEFEFGTEDFAIEGLKQAQYWPTVRHLLTADFGVLRQAKMAAWILLDRIGWPENDEARRGGFTREQYEAGLMRTLRQIDPRLAHDFTQKGELSEGLEKLIVDLYYFCSATVLNRRAYEALNQITLSHAVAASANFPPMFTPFKINDLFESRHLNAVLLTDGGVHDNQGIEWLLDVGCTDIIASDAGGLVSVERNPAEARLPMMDRIIDVLMGGVRRVLLRSVRDTLRLSSLLSRTVTTSTDVEELAELKRSVHLQRAIVFHMTSHPRDAAAPAEEDTVYLKPFEPQLVAALRTDLDAFNDLEIAALRHQGYQLADSYTRAMAELPEFRLQEGYQPPKSPVTLQPGPNERHRRILAAGAHRVARYSVAYPLRAAFFALFIALMFTILAINLDDWTSWESIRRVTNVNLADKYLKSTGRRTLYQKLVTTKTWRAFAFTRDVIDDAVSHVSIITQVFVGWALLLVLREFFRASNAARKRVMFELKLLQQRNTFSRSLELLKRPTNAISLAALLLFFSTLNVKWLFGVIYLWIFPVALFFFFVHLVFTSLWLSAGRNDDIAPPGESPSAQAAQPTSNAA